MRGPANLAVAEIARDLGLSEGQRAQIEILSSAVVPRIERLQAALAAIEEELSRAEMALPFDEALVAGWVTRRAEASAYLRGTESRLIGLIVQILTPQQRARFAEFRSVREAEYALACVASRGRSIEP